MTQFSKHGFVGVSLIALCGLGAGPAFAEICEGTTYSTPTVFWTDWQTTVYEGGTTKYYGEIEVTRPDGTVEIVEVRYSGPRGVGFFQTGSGTDFFADSARVRNASTSPFTSETVPTIPPAAEMIALRYSQTNTLEFSQDVGNPLFAFVSLNGNGYGFDRDFTVLSYGHGNDGNACGYWGCGTAARTLTSGGQYMLSGSGEPHGTLQFNGSFSTVNWNSLRDEYWNGFTLGIVGLAADVNTDADCDGIDDSVDNCPNDANADQADTDGDGIGDVCDPSLDTDGDGIDNDSDNCPDTANADQTDTDGDGDGDACDNCPDTANADQADSDDNGIGDACDVVEVDADGDGWLDDEDNCPDTANPDQADADEDGLGDVCDPDADGDGFEYTDDCDDFDASINPDAVEVCDDTLTDDDCDGLIDEEDDDADCDGDGIDNGIDNCPDEVNPGQLDTDGDSWGDVCDDDDDEDGVLDGDDNCSLDANADQADQDDDGLGDVCDDDADGDLVDDIDDLCLFDPGYDAPTSRLGTNRWADIDGDGIFDTNSKGNKGHSGGYTIDDTAGCTCAQIIETCGYGNGHVTQGCSNSVMDWWTGLYDQAGEAPFQCKED
jgi:hypothetical protein